MDLLDQALCLFRVSTNDRLWLFYHYYNILMSMHKLALREKRTSYLRNVNESMVCFVYCLFLPGRK